MVNITTTLEWTGCALGLLGAAMLAFNFRHSRYGWLAFLGANVAMISFALLIDKHGLLVSQIGFACTSVLGIWRSGFFSRSESAAEVMTTDADAAPGSDQLAPVGQAMGTAVPACRAIHPRTHHAGRPASGDYARAPHGNT